MSAPIPLPQPNGPGLYTKLIISAVVAAGGTLSAAQSDGLIETGEWIAIAVTFLVNLGAVWAIPMAPEWLATYGKAVASGLISGLGSLGTGLSDGSLTSAEITTAVLALIIGTGLVTVSPNSLTSDPVDPATNKQVPIPAEVKEQLALEGSTTTSTTRGVVTVEAGPDPFDEPRRNLEG